MDGRIAFPHLHLYFESIGKSFRVFGFEIAYYGVVIAVGMLLGVMYALREAKRTGQNVDHYFNMLMIAIVSGIIGARIYYVAFRWDYYRYHISEIINYRNGGIAIYGGVIGAVAAIWIYTRVKKMSFRLVTDTCCPGLLIGQILGRWGNFFNREAFGDYTDGLFAMQLPRSVVRSSDVTEKMAKNIADGMIQVHPTFLYESLWNIGVFVILMICKKRKKFDGELFLLYLLGYGIGRAWIEGLRTDQLLIPVIKVPVSKVLSVVLAVCAAVLLIINRRKLKKLVDSDGNL